MLHTKLVEKIKTQLMSNNFSRKSCRLCDDVEKYCTAGQAADEIMAHAHCMLDAYGYRHTQYVTLSAFQLQ